MIHGETGEKMLAKLRKNVLYTIIYSDNIEKLRKWLKAIPTDWKEFRISKEEPSNFHSKSTQNNVFDSLLFNSEFFPVYSPNFNLFARLQHFYRNWKGITKRINCSSQTNAIAFTWHFANIWPGNKRRNNEIIYKFSRSYEFTSHFTTTHVVNVTHCIENVDSICARKKRSNDDRNVDEGKCERHKLMCWPGNVVNLYVSETLCMWWAMAKRIGCKSEVWIVSAHWITLNHHSVKYLNWLSRACWSRRTKDTTFCWCISTMLASVTHLFFLLASSTQRRLAS